MPDKLLSGMARKAAEHLRAGGTIRPIAQARWSKDLAHAINAHITDWLSSRKSAGLIALLRKYPVALSHPAVLTSLAKMRQLSRRGEGAEAQIEGYAEIDGEEFSIELCVKARDLLHLVACALVAGLLGSGWEVIPSPQKRGRPKRRLEDVVEAFEVLSHYEHVLDSLRKAQTKRHRDESDSSWRARLDRIVRDTWASTIGVSTVVDTSSVGSDPMDDRLTIRTAPLDLPPESLTRCLDKALSAGHDGLPNRDILAYGLVAQRWNREPSSIKHLVEVARAAR